MTRASCTAWFVKVCGRPASVTVTARGFRPSAFIAEQLFGRPLDTRAAPALFERVSPEAMPQRKRGHTFDVCRGDRPAPLERREGACGACDRDLAAVPVHAEPQAEPGYLPEEGCGESLRPRTCRRRAPRGV